MSSIFYSEKLRVLNFDFASGLKSKFSYSYDIFLDTQIVSYIDRYMKNKLDSDLEKIILPLQINRCIQSTMNFFPYIMENYIKENTFNKIISDNIYNSLTFFNLPIMSSRKAKRQALKQTKKLKKYFIKLKSTLNIYRERYNYIYTMLLKIIILYFDNCKIKDKMINLINFENNKTYTSDFMFINIAYEVWTKGTKSPFFGKIQRGKNNILEIIKNMAWDIYHWYHTFMGISFEPTSLVDVNLPLFYTIDKRFLELSKIIKLSCLAYDKITGNVYPFFKNECIKKILSEQELFQHFNMDTLHTRHQYRKLKVDTKNLSHMLEDELLKMIK